jgi:hypothetical protein
MASIALYLIISKGFASISRRILREEECVVILTSNYFGSQTIMYGLNAPKSTVSD